MPDEFVEITVEKPPVKRGERVMGSSVALQYLQKKFPPGAEMAALKYLTIFRGNPDLIACTYAFEHLLNGKVISDMYLMNLALMVQNIERELENV